MKINELNKIIKRCCRCELSETRTNAICGEGNPNAKIMLIAQAPGEKEDKEGRMFVGPTGKVLDEIFNMVGISRNEFYMTNLIKCMLPDYRKPKRFEIEACGFYLNKEIEIVNPEILVPLGYYATRFIFEKYGLSLPPKAEFSSIYGKLFLANERKVLPLQHPSSVLYNPENRQTLIKTYRKLMVLRNYCKWYKACPMRRFYEAGKLDKKWIELYCKGDWEVCIRYQMEERGEYHPDWMLPDGSLDQNLKREMKNI